MQTFLTIVLVLCFAALGVCIRRSRIGETVLYYPIFNFNMDGAWDSFHALERSGRANRCHSHWSAKKGRGGKKKSNRLNMRRLTKLKHRKAR